MSQSALRRIFLAADFANVSGGRLDLMKKAMDHAINKRIRHHEVKLANDEHGGIWLEPADVIREMITSAGLKPGQIYDVNIMGDGRCFGNARNTTFFALRLVKLKGHRSTSQEALWPLAIFDTKEDRGPLRALTRDLRRALRHVQKNGVHLSTSYSNFHNFIPPGDEGLDIPPEDDDPLQNDDIKDDPISDYNFERSTQQRSAIFNKIDELAAMRSGANSTNNQDHEHQPPPQEVSDSEDASDSTDDDGDDAEIPPEYNGGTEAFWDMNDEDCKDTDDDEEKYTCRLEKCDCKFHQDKTHVGVVLWLSADMKFLGLVSGQPQATAKFACLFCKASKEKRYDWDKDHLCPNRTSSDPIDSSNGQVRKNLFFFIPKDHVILDTLHLLMRCVERLVDQAIRVLLETLRPDLSTPETKLEFINKYLAPTFATAMGKGRIHCTSPKGSSTLWGIAHGTGVTYKKLLQFFKFSDIITRHNFKLTPRNRTLLERHQECWKGFLTIYTEVNSAQPTMMPRMVKELIYKWFQAYVSGEKVNPHPEPLFLASFICTPYFHGLLDHIPDMLEVVENLRQFCGQSFERRNNEHRLFWQNSNKVKGQEIPSIIHQDLRNCMNPITKFDKDLLWQCPAELLCPHKPFTYKKSFAKHLRKDHNIVFNVEEQAKGRTEGEARRKLTRAAHKEFAKQVTDAFTIIENAHKQVVNTDHAKNGKERYTFHKELRE